MGGCLKVRLNENVSSMEDSKCDIVWMSLRTFFPPLHDLTEVFHYSGEPSGDVTSFRCQVQVFFVNWTGLWYTYDRSYCTEQRPSVGLVSLTWFCYVDVFGRWLINRNFRVMMLEWFPVRLCPNTQEFSFAWEGCRMQVGAWGSLRVFASDVELTEFGAWFERVWWAF